VAFQWVAGTSTNAVAIGPEARILYQGVIRKSASQGNYPNITFDGTPISIRTEEYPDADRYIKNPPEGAKYLRLTLDPDNAIPELMEDNNSIALSPPAVTDFEITSMEMREDRFRVTMRNTGGAVDSLLVHFFWMNAGRQLLPVGAYFPMSYRVSVATFREGALREIGPQKRYDEFLSEPPEGAAAIRIVIDPNDEILESNEGNNTYEFVLSGQAMAEMDEETAVGDLAEEVQSGIDEGNDASTEAAPAAEEAAPAEQAHQQDSGQVSESGGASSGGSGASAGKGADPKVLPGNPLYFLKDGIRGVSLLFTFGKENKAKAHLKIANEKLIEANKLIKLGKEEKAVSHLEKYADDLNAAKKLAGQIQNTKPDVSQDLASTILRNEVKQLQVLGTIEKRVSPEYMDTFVGMKEGVLGGVTESVALVQDPQAVEKALASAVATTGSPLKQFRNLEVLQTVYEQVPEQAKGSISFAIQKSASRLDKEVSSLSSADGGALLTDYVKNAGGSEVSYIKVLDGLKQNKNVSLDAKVLGAAKEGTVALLGDRLSKAGSADVSVSQKVIHELEAGSFENLRAVQDIKASIDPKFVPLIKKAEDASLKNLSNSAFSNELTQSPAFKEELRDEKLDEAQILKLDAFRKQEIASQEKFVPPTKLVPPVKEEVIIPSKKDEKKVVFPEPKTIEPKEPFSSPTLENFAEELTKKQFGLPEGPSPFHIQEEGEPAVTVDLNKLYEQTFDALKKYNQEYLKDMGVSSEDIQKAYEFLPLPASVPAEEVPMPDVSLEFPTEETYSIPAKPVVSVLTIPEIDVPALAPITIPTPIPAPTSVETKLVIPDVTKLQIPSVSSGTSLKAKPDFIIVSGSVSVSPSPLAIGKSATFRATIQNIGADAGVFQSETKNVAIGTEGSSEAYLEIDTNGDGAW
ncbi:MAG: DUF5667 domain-containing protein, partial [Candidatus Wolfebacteria bacterium]|nr:DUF5667 domain-containing protein [Candidatus Wolfebacteria bacterium]